VAASIAAPAARLGTVRVKIDPGVGEQEETIRTLLGAYPFVQIGEPADYLLTTNPDFPLDVTLYDLRQPPEQWNIFDRFGQQKTPEPRHFPIGNLAADGASERLGAVLTAAARVRALLDRSLADMQGVEACLIRRVSPEPDSGWTTCIPLNDVPKAFDWTTAGLVRLRNRAASDRYVSIAAADGSLAMGWFGQDGDPPVRKLAPGETAEYLPMYAGHHFPDDPRVIVLVSARPFTVDALAQPAPLPDDPECQGDDPPAACRPTYSPLALSDDLAVRSFQLVIYEEPMPAMGGGSDVTASMAVWMAQFYSVIPYTPAEIAADSKLPDDKSQFLARRTYEERQHRCGASLIGPNLVLTAAHCVAKGQYAGDGLAKVLKQRRVRLGSRKIGQGGQSFAIAGVAVHAGYDPNRQNHDIALLLLRPDRGSGSAQPPPISVADKPLPGGVNALGFGWGLTGAVAPNGNIMLTLDSRLQGNADVLQYGEMRSVTLNECKKKFSGEVAAGMVCMYSKSALAGGQGADGVFTCRGDSGGPLVRKIGGRDVLVGLVSWSKGCGYKDYPSVFTDAGSYAAWIAAARAELKPGAAIRPKDPARPR
jgi:hypothetical protein